MSTWREKAKKLLDSLSGELTKLTKAPFGSFGSESSGHISIFKPQIAAANDPPVTGYGTGCDTYRRPLAPLVQCGECVNFIRNRDNFEAGIGTCKLGEPDLGGWPYFPGARRCCLAFEATNIPEVST